MLVYGAFVSHGSPEILLHNDDPWISAFKAIGRALRETHPETIVMVSPHSFTDFPKFLLGGGSVLNSINDYYGFPEELYNFHYTFKNDLELVDNILRLAKAHAIEIAKDESLGLDHGSWIPLKFMEKMDGNFVTVSVNGSDPESHYILGRIIREASREKRVAIIATGSPTHRLDLLYFGLQRKIYEFDKKLMEIILSGRLSEVKLLEGTPEYNYSAPEGMNRTFYVLSGALGDIKGSIIDYSVVLPGLSMLAAEFKLN